MQDAYVGDIGDFGKYGMLRLVGYSGLRLAVNWYRVIPDPSVETRQDDGKYVQYLNRPQEFRAYDSALFDALQKLILTDRDRKISRIERSGILDASYYSAPLQGDREAWHREALAHTVDADIVFLDPDNGLETRGMYARNGATEKHVRLDELRDYYERGQSVILYQHRPQMTKKELCIQSVLDLNRDFIGADDVYILEFPRWSTRYYFFFVHREHAEKIRQVCDYMDTHWQGMCQRVDRNSFV